jgi:hypothetical protein
MANPRFQPSHEIENTTKQASLSNADTERSCGRGGEGALQWLREHDVPAVRSLKSEWIVAARTPRRGRPPKEHPSVALTLLHDEKQNFLYS